MGIDLRLLPFDSDQGEFAFSHTILNVDRNYDLYGKIRELRTMPVPEGFTSFVREGGYGITRETPYGERLEYALAGEICSIQLPDGASYIEQAAWAYLSHLPPLTKVALYWH